MSRRAKKNVHRNATLIGRNHLLNPHARVGLSAGAKKENVVLEDSCWLFGVISVQSEGKVIMHKHSKIGGGSIIMCVNKVEIGAYTAIGNNTTICDNNNHPVNPVFRKQMRLSSGDSEMRLWKHSTNSPIIIGENCWIGSNVRICKGVSIGDNAVVAANSVVTKDVPENSIVAGNPAKVVKTDIQDIPAPTSSPEFNAFLQNSIK